MAAVSMAAGLMDSRRPLDPARVKRSLNSSNGSAAGCPSSGPRRLPYDLQILTLAQLLLARTNICAASKCTPSVKVEVDSYAGLNGRRLRFPRGRDSTLRKASIWQGG
jgi:hypothetical protein